MPIHGYANELTLKLRGPDDAEVILKTAVGTPQFEDLDGTYPSPLTPEGDLDEWNGRDANGPWTLSVTDFFAYEAGTLGGWSLRLTCE